MRLSEAMRLGAMNRAQGLFKLLTEDDRTCAMGAALDAVGLLASVSIRVSRNCSSIPEPSELERFPILTLKVDHPSEAGCSDDLISIISSLNDYHGWTREQIADWVESIELAQEPVIETADHPAMEPACAIRSAAP